MAGHREEPHTTPGPLNGGPGEGTHRFVRWALARGPWLWFAALALAVPSAIAMVRLYLNLTSEIEELLPEPPDGSRIRVSLATLPPLVAEVTRESAEAMGLMPGRRVHASFKAAGLTIQ